MKLSLKAALFIDGSNMYHAQKALGWNVDWKELIGALEQETNTTILQRRYYTATWEDEDGLDVTRRLVDWLAFNGFHLVTKEAKSYQNQAGKNRIKGNIDVEMATDLALLPIQFECVIIMTGDGDFCYTLDKLQDRGVHVIVVSTRKSNPPIVANSLRRQADRFIDLEDMKQKIVQRSRVEETDA